MQRTVIIVLIVAFILMVIRKRKASSNLRNRKRSLVNRMREAGRLQEDDEDRT